MKNESTSLSPKAFENAATFLISNARPLEIARFENIFGDGDIDDVLIELAKFQNPDGGFGHALEADLRTPASSALCTSIAFQIMRDHQVSKEEKMAQRAISYLMDTLDRNELHWRIIPESADTAPHAPWWTQEGRDQFSLNPTAEILGYLLDYGGSVVDEQITSQITSRVLETLRSLKALEMHDLLCCLRLQKTKNLPANVRDIVQHELKRLIADTVETSPEKWGEYCLRPLQVVHSPDSPFMNGLEEVVSLNLDFEIKEQQDNGSWPPTWTWGDQFPEAWETAKREWSGFQTLEKLLLLKRFDHIERNV